MERPHEATDRRKVARLIRSMRRSGWQGPPLVVDGENLITGVHRYEAWTRMTRYYQHSEFGLPTIELEAVFDEAGLDIDEAWERACDLVRSGEHGGDTMLALFSLLPKDIREYYGIDWH